MHLIFTIFFISGKGNHSETKEIVCGMYVFFLSEYDNAKSRRLLIPIKKVLDTTLKTTDISKSTKFNLGSCTTDLP